MDSLNKFQRLALCNQYKIMKALEIDADQIHEGHYDHRIEILEKGYTYHYDTIFSGLEDEVSFEKHKEVIDILQMFRSFDNSIHEFGEENLDAAGVDVRKLRLRGFDHQKHRLYIAEYEAQGEKWEELQDLVGDNHNPIPEMEYEEMLKKINKKQHKYNHTIEDLLEYAPKK